MIRAHKLHLKKKKIHKLRKDLPEMTFRGKCKITKHFCYHFDTSGIRQYLTLERFCTQSSLPWCPRSTPGFSFPPIFWYWYLPTAKITFRKESYRVSYKIITSGSPLPGVSLHFKMKVKEWHFSPLWSEDRRG